MKLVRVPLRISFLGGGSDIPKHYQKPGAAGAVLSVAIDKYIYITTKPISEYFTHNFRIVYSQIEEVNSVQEIKHPIIRAVLGYTTTKGLDLDVMSDIPAGTGLGSSSAFTVGMWASTTGHNASKAVLAHGACHTEIVELKEPIGKQDQFACAYGGLNLFRFRSNDEVSVCRLQLSEDALEEFRKSLVLVYIGGQRSASKILKKQNKDFGTLNEMAYIAQRGFSALKNGELEDFGCMLQRNWELKKSMSPDISTPYIDHIITGALEAGAYGAKLLGAGGAGFVLIVVKPGATRQCVLDRLSSMSLEETEFNFDMQGAKVLYAD